MNDTLEKAEMAYSSEVKKQVKINKVPFLHKFYMLIFSGVLSLLSVAMPFFTDFANSLQSQNLYIGMMMSKGQMPYSDVFASGGFLYYALIALSYLMRSTIWLVILEFVTFYLSGIYFYKIIYHLTKNRDVVAFFNLVFYSLNLILGFGGLYPIQWAMPFVLIALWFLMKYFRGIVNDEAFILYGFVGSIALLLDPQTFLFWPISFLAIAVYNVKQKHMARGFYQLLCIVFGTILVLYIAGYFMFNLQLILPYIKEALIYPLTHFAAGKDAFWYTLPLQAFILFSSGLVWGFIHFMRKGRKESTDIVILWLIAVVWLVYAVRILLVQDCQLYYGLTILPLGLAFTAIYVADLYQSSLTKDKTSHRRHRKVGSSRVGEIFMGRHAVVSWAVLVYALFLLSANVTSTLAHNGERSTIATYLKNNAGDSLVYVWDRSAKIYLDGKLKTGSQFVLPIAAANATDQKILEDELLQHDAKYIAVNSKLSISSILKKDLSKNYKQVSISGTKDFKVYKLK